MNKIACVFPGQGSQRVGMMSDIAQFPEVKSVIEEASQALGLDMWKLVQEDPQGELNSTEFTQPALLMVSYAMWQLVKANGITPQFMAGHSLGEYSALVCAGAISFHDAIKLVRFRGKLMQEAVPKNQGAMAAIIGLEPAAVALLCEQACLPDEILEAVNFNAPGQIVIAGHKASIEKALTQAKPMGAKMAVLLPVSVPAHSSLMKAASQKLQESIMQLQMNMPHIAVVHNVNASVSRSVDEIKQALVAQLYSPVLWVDSIRLMVHEGVTEMVEVGPGTVLSGLMKRIDSQISMMNAKIDGLGRVK